MPKVLDTEGRLIEGRMNTSYGRPYLWNDRSVYDPAAGEVENSEVLSTEPLAIPCVNCHARVEVVAGTTRTHRRERALLHGL